MKVDLPRFFRDDSYGWIAMAEEFLDYHELDDHRRETVAGLHLGGMRLIGCVGSKCVSLYHRGLRSPPNYCNDLGPLIL